MFKDQRAKYAGHFLRFVVGITHSQWQSWRGTPFWSQCGQHNSVDAPGFSRKMPTLLKLSARTLVRLGGLVAICAKPGEDRPEALFEIAYGPKPGQRSGRVRWLFRMPRGDEHDPRSVSPGPDSPGEAAKVRGQSERKVTIS